MAMPTEVVEDEPTALGELRERWAGTVRRPCAGCTACCDHFDIEEIDKAAKQTCPLKAAFGCSVHATTDMPRVCSTYACAWAMGYGKPSDRPDLSGVIVDFRDGSSGEGLYGHTVAEVTEATVTKLHRAVVRISKIAMLPVHFEGAGDVNFEHIKRAG